MENYEEYIAMQNLINDIRNSLDALQNINAQIEPNKRHYIHSQVEVATNAVNRIGGEIKPAIVREMLRRDLT